ncbi:MAG: FapA family protein, partial [Phycisphaerales bacterium]
AAPVDHYNRVRRLKVAAGQVLGTLVAPGEGVDGRDVCGRSVAAKRGRKLALQPDGTVQVEADGTIRALKDGVLSLARLRISIVDSLEVAGAVDFSTGNIDFVGSVKVADGVRDNFTLRATGDVTVHGLVEAADLIVGGDCTCERGVAARNSGRLLVDGSLEAAYLNGVRGRVRGSVALDREIVGCELLVGGDLSVSRGSIVGGTLIVGGALKAASIGTEGGAKTAIRLGGLPLELVQAARIADLAKELSKRAAPLEERERLIAEKGDKATAAEKESHTELAFEIAEVHRRVRLLEEKRAAILRKAGESRMLKVHVEKAIHEGTTLLVGAREVKFTRTVKGPVQLGWDENRNLQFRVAGGRVQDLREVATIREVA